jgi:hypothetical protein
MPSINNFLAGFSNGLPGMKDYAHASRLYVDDNFKLMPKQKFLFHVVFDIDNTIPIRAFNPNEKLELNMLVKSCELPKYDMNVEEKLQYNKKVYVGTRIIYKPVTITFYDDHADTVNLFWKSYYEYNIADSLSVNSSNLALTKDDMYDERQISQFGMDNAQKRKKPFLKNIQIFSLHKKQFTSFTLVNPVIGSFSHDDLDATDGAGVMSNTMQIFYETVLYGAGKVDTTDPLGFATIHYDKEPSPLSLLGGGTTSIFGPGGIVDGIGSVIGDVANGQVNVGTILKGINTYNNAKKIKAKDAVKEELKGIVKKGVLEIGKQAGTITNPISGFNILNVGAATAGLVGTVAVSKSLIDNKENKSTISQLNSVVIDTKNFLTPTEAFNLIQNNQSIQDKVASGIYYKVVGSRNGQSILQSDINFSNLSVQDKNVYRSRAVNSVIALISEGYLKINRESFDVNINAEKVNL